MKQQKKIANRDIRFVLKTAPGSKVYLIGSFNRWNSKKTIMSGPDDSGNYSVTLSLCEGVYEYLFVVNGEWQTDPVNPRFALNAVGIWSSVIEVVG